MRPELGGAATQIATRAERELEALVAISSPSGDLEGAEKAIALCTSLGPFAAQSERVPCSTDGCAPDLILRIRGGGRRRILLLGHLDTVIPHQAHGPLRRDGEKLYGPGSADMKGGVVLALGVARQLAAQPERFAELAVLLVVDEEWRTTGFSHVGRFSGYDACLCFEAGELTAEGQEAVVVRRKAAGTMRVSALGRAAHSGSAPDAGASALLALAELAPRLASMHDPHGPERLTLVPTVLRSGEALNVVPPAGELLCDMRADSLSAFDAVLASVPARLGEVSLQAAMDRRWPGMDTRASTAALLERGGKLLGRDIVGVDRGGASDASHFAGALPLTVDGLGPRGGGAHAPHEYVLRQSLGERAEVALAVAQAVLEQ